MKNQFQTIWICLFFAVAIALPLSAKPPNVIFILVDDQGYYDLGCYGATEFKTPNIDRMAKEGIRFTDYYAAAPICSPSRAGLLTGCYPRRVGLATWVQRADSTLGIHPKETTLAELFNSNGYATACIGKWHLGFKKPFLPRQQGFDHYFGLLHNLDPVEVIYFKAKGGVPLLRNGKVVKRPANPAELTEAYTNEAIQFMENNKDKPFFIYLPHTMLHNPLGVSEKFQGRSKYGQYGDAIEELDYHVGRIFTAMKRLKLSDNTIVVYASDNGRGPGRNEKQLIRGRKLSTLEGGIRVPCLAWGPGVGIKAKSESSEVVHAMDWYPTLATFAGIRLSLDNVIDGRDISPLLTGKAKTIPSLKNNSSLNAHVPFRRPWNPPAEWKSSITRDEYSRAYFYHGSQGALAAVRLDQWKLYLNPSLQLYDLENDPGEKKLVRNPKMMRKLRGTAILFQNEMREDARLAGDTSNPDFPLFLTSKQPSKTVIPFFMKEIVQTHQGLTYATYDKRSLQLDLYRPKQNKKALPAIVCIHGGGWAKGSRENHRHVAMSLAAHGFVTVTISYRLSGEAPFPAAIHDCKAAVRWLRANAERYGINPERIGAIGLSAGGHLTALLGTSNGVAELEGEGGNATFSSAIQAAVPMGAQTNLESERVGRVSAIQERGKIWRQFLGGSQKEKTEVYKLASPLFHLDAKDPPMALITGEKDDVSTRAIKFRAAMKKLHIPAHLKIIPDAPHPFLVQQKWFDESMNYAASFFTVHLKNSP